MVEWKEYKLSEVTSILGDGIHGTPQYDDEGSIYFINGNNLENGHIVIKDNTKRVSYEESLKHQKPLSERTILVSINGTIGNVAKYNGEPCILGKSACYFNVNEDVDLDFIYYVVANNNFKDTITRLATGTTIKNVSLKTMREYSFMMPPIETQKRVSSILKSLDDKIEVNRRINEQLEELAQALFKSWFVDFEPFKDGEFVESELGMIPEGWKVGTLGELIEIKYGKDHKKLDDGNIPVYGSGGIMRYVNKSLFTGESVLIPRKGTLNNVMYVNRDFWTVDTMFFSKMKVPNIAIFVYLFLSKKDLASMNSGSAVPSMTVDILNRIQLVIPSDKVFEDYNNVASSLFAQMSNNSKEIIYLTNLRDTLLPKLMSGDIDVNDVEI